MRLMGNPRPAWFLGHLSQIKRAVDLGIGKRFGLIGKWERDAFIVRLQSVLQKNGQFGIPRLPSGEHISVTRWCPQCGNISGEFPFRALHFPLFWERSKQSGGVPPFYWLVSTNFGRKRDFLSQKCPKPKMPKHWVFWARNARLGTLPNKKNDIIWEFFPNVGPPLPLEGKNSQNFLFWPIFFRIFQI